MMTRDTFSTMDSRLWLTDTTRLDNRSRIDTWDMGEGDILCRISEDIVHICKALIVFDWIMCYVRITCAVRCVTMLVCVNKYDWIVYDVLFCK